MKDFLKNKLRKSQIGQSTIEFLISFTVVFGMTFFIVKVTLDYGNGYYLHWATYVASRAYSVYDEGQNGAGIGITFSSAENRARALFDLYRINGVTLSFNDMNAAGRNVLIGAYAEYETKFSPMTNINPDQRINFRSESFLGKEPPRGYCHEIVRDKILDAAGGGFDARFMTVFDNGC